MSQTGLGTGTTTRSSFAPTGRQHGCGASNPQSSIGNGKENRGRNRTPPELAEFMFFPSTGDFKACWRAKDPLDQSAFLSAVDNSDIVPDEFRRMGKVMAYFRRTGEVSGPSRPVRLVAMGPAALQPQPRPLARKLVRTRPRFEYGAVEPDKEEKRAMACLP